MKITILTLFPQMFNGPFGHSIINRAREKNLVEIEFVNIRDFGTGKHRIVDDTEYGGGVGMVLKVEILHKAIEYAKKRVPRVPKARDTRGTRLPAEALAKAGGTHDTFTKVVLLSATGKTYNQQKAREYSKLDHLIMICGHYEGVDERVKNYIDEEVSIGDFILTGGEIPAMLIADSVTRLIPSVLPIGAVEEESFSQINGETLLEYPHFTSPRSHEGYEVPTVLLSGDHKKIKKWRDEKSKEITRKLRPDLLKKRNG
jgi:tRNA (guanine37-N1)-methyltransferase